MPKITQKMAVKEAIVRLTKKLNRNTFTVKEFLDNERKNIAKQVTTHGKTLDKNISEIMTRQLINEKFITRLDQGYYQILDTIVNPTCEEAKCDSKGDRITSVVERIVRDTLLVKEIKELHKHKCQLCGEIIKLKTGHYYCEAHHIKPLGEPHGGPDEAYNLLIVCPNCHVQLDYATIQLDINKLRRGKKNIRPPEYAIDQACVDHHNARYSQNNLCPRRATVSRQSTRDK